MSNSLALPEAELLLARMLSGESGAEDDARLNRLLQDDPALRTLYRKYMTLDAMLRWEFSPPILDIGGASGRRPDASGQWPVVSGQRGESLESRVESWTDIPEIPVINLQIAKSQNLPIPRFPLPSPLSSLPSAWAFSYSVATVLLAVFLLGAWSYTIIHPAADSLAVKSSRNATLSRGTEKAPAEFTFVGRVSGMVDCHWAEEATASYPGAGVALNRRYALRSGLMEITYDSGAKVILQGPCEYTVESPRGGFLKVGKLVARMDSAKPQAANPEFPNSRTPNPKFPTPHAPRPTPLFAVRTPTALVEDLGTEFGVEVNDRGSTTSHVFQGQVLMRATAGGSSDAEVILGANEAASVQEDDANHVLKLLKHDASDAARRYVCRLPQPPRPIDLLDIVAGGDGTGSQRECGIDPTTGQIDRLFVAKYRDGDRQFHKIAWSRMIDGVFVPDGSKDAMTIDSAGHKFDGFPPTSGTSWGSIWVRSADMSVDTDAKQEHCWMHELGNVDSFMPNRRGLLGLHPNAGISISLDAIRHAHGNAVPARFRAILGMGNAAVRSSKLDGLAEVWILVDGHLKFHRTISPTEKPIVVDIAFGRGDRSLTLATTDGAGIKGKYAGSWKAVAGDWVFFGDPIVQLNIGETAERLWDNRKEADRNQEP
jgi:hypothetical protein